jgi:hypothetical protein
MPATESGERRVVSRIVVFMEGYANGLAAYGAADAMDISVGEDAATHQALGSGQPAMEWRRAGE